MDQSLFIGGERGGGERRLRICGGSHGFQGKWGKSVVADRI